MFDDFHLSPLKNDRSQNGDEHDEDRLNNNDDGAQETIVVQRAQVRRTLAYIHSYSSRVLFEGLVLLQFHSIHNECRVIMWTYALAFVGAQVETITRTMMALGKKRINENEVTTTNGTKARSASFVSLSRFVLSTCMPDGHRCVPPNGRLSSAH